MKTPSASFGHCSRNWAGELTACLTETPTFFTDPVATVERLSFRTGAWRDRGFGGRDLPGTDSKVPLASFLVDDVVITPVD
jgi:hypothetical protein